MCINNINVLNLHIQRDRFLSRMEKKQTASKQRLRTKVFTPDYYKVIFHNDDFTTMEFVVMLLRVVFFKDESDAQQLMLTVHKKGRATVGVYPCDVAMSKRDKAMHMAKKEGYPLRITCETD